MIFVAFLSIYCLIITTAYSSSLTAFLTVKQLPKTFETLKELRGTGLKIGGLGPGFGSAEGNEDLQVVISRFISYSTMKDLLEDVLQGKSVMLLNRRFLEYAMVTPQYEGQPDPKTTLRILRECFFTYSTGMYLQKNSPYKQKFNTVIGRMLNGGLVRKWFWDSLSISNQRNLEKHRKKLANEPQKQNSTTTTEADVSSQDDNAVVSLELDHLQGIFFVLFVGYGIATIAFLLEIFCERKKRLRWL